MATTATLDKTIYTVGELMTLTVKSDSRTVPIHVVVGTGADTAIADTKAVKPITLTDASGHIWAKKSDDGITAVYTSTA